MARPVLAADLGGTKITTAYVDSAARIHHIHTFPTGAMRGADAILADLEAGLARSRAEALGAGLPEPEAVGIASAGVVDSARGVITSATDAIPGWAGTAIGPSIARGLGLPAAVLNDVHAHGLGEAIHGAGAGHAAMLMVAVGTGIGGAIVREGRVVVGAHSAAAHVGHIPVPEAAGVPCTCGRVGHAEGLASGPGILAAYEREGGVARDTREIAERAGAGEELAKRVLSRCAVATGRMVGALLNVVDPDLVVVSGGVAAAGALWWDQLRVGVAQEAMSLLADTPLVEAQAGVNAALLGAAHFAQPQPEIEGPGR